MYALGIDTSNYATSLAVYDGKAGSVCLMEKQFLPVRQGALGLRQSDAVLTPESLGKNRIIVLDYAG